VNENGLPPGLEPSLPSRPGLFVVLILLAGLFLSGLVVGVHVSGTTDTGGSAADASGGHSDPILTTPAQKLAELSDEAFTRRLFDETTALDARLRQPGAQVHMGFYSGPGNHGNLVRLLDDINSSDAGDGSVDLAIWDEGATSALQIPSYFEMEREMWYERAYPVDGAAIVYGVPRRDFAPVTPEQADAVWGQFSRRYTDQAVLYEQATGRPVQAWCFVQGAGADRIFYTNEFVELQRLEAEGVVEVHFAKKADADWADPSDWTHGTANHPPALKE